MPLDELVGNRVARRMADHGMRSAFMALVLAACGPAVHPQGPGEPEPGSAATPTKGPPPHSTKPPPAIARTVLVGEMCPQGAAGRPGIDPLFLHRLDWTVDPGEVHEPLERGEVHQLAVVAGDGRRAGVFTVMGTADVVGVDVAIGSYAGASPCARPPSTTGTPAKEDPACVAATQGCGLAVTTIDPGDDAYTGADADTIAAVPPIAQACVAGDTLVVDIDGDGAAETYSLPSFLDQIRGPADEITAVPTASPPCQGSFARWDALVDAGTVPGTAPDPRYRVAIDLIGAIDLDGDGRKELVVAFRGADYRTIAIYSATSSAARLERVGEVIPWSSAGSP